MMLIRIEVFGILIALSLATLPSQVSSARETKRSSIFDILNNKCMNKIGSLQEDIDLKQKKIIELEAILKAAAKTNVSDVIDQDKFDFQHSLQLCKSHLFLSNEKFHKLKLLNLREVQKILEVKKKMHGETDSNSYEKQVIEKTAWCEKWQSIKIKDTTRTIREWKAVKADFSKVNETLVQCQKQAYSQVEEFLSIVRELMSRVYTVFVKYINKITQYNNICESDVAVPGWIVIQRRILRPNAENFTRNWQDYRQGFGRSASEFWLGLDNLYRLTHLHRYELAILFVDQNDHQYMEKYNDFVIGGEEDNFKIVSLGNYSGPLGGGLRDRIGVPFSTYDRVNAAPNESCSGKYKEGWWYTDCEHGNLNTDFSSCDLGKPSSDLSPACTFSGFSIFVPKRVQMMIRYYFP
ncbi:PREDICTED: angiopoietin-2-like [Drosophila arizonae]|uniref:Angiopoietin-2-like n=1 Tax=Drosophila arizonae TaxID=7263 RepID=A0ABM1PCD4_DROAR|nr:PREDICTED: angiopoietin-2-like [Drosophila arizonae]